MEFEDRIVAWDGFEGDVRVPALRGEFGSVSSVEEGSSFARDAESQSDIYEEWFHSH